MLSTLASLAMPALRSIDPEQAHSLAIRALASGALTLGAGGAAADDAKLSVAVLGQRFSNPIGIAAGFDKNAEAGPAIFRLGLGFVETGTVTPLPQAGNPRPRIFRLKQDQAIINRLGFNNKGLANYLENLRQLSGRSLPLGANVGINKEGADPARDYPALISAVRPLVDYAVINVSSPNTPGLRDLQSEAQLRLILAAVMTVADGLPILVKVAPDLSDDGLAEVVATCIEAGIQGLIVSNTTISRPRGLMSPLASQMGGLSGTPLRRLSTRMLAKASLLAQGRLVLIGAGGIFTGAHVLEKLQAGASLVQLYTAFAYEGPALIPRLKHELLAALDEAGLHSVSDAVGTRSRELAEDN